MHYLDNYKTFNCFKVIFVNLDGLPSTMTLARTMIKHPKGWKRYRNACKKKIITTSRAVFYKDIIYVADRKKFSDKNSLRIILKGLKSALKRHWESPVVIPTVYLCDPEEFKKTVRSYSDNEVIFTDELSKKV